MEPEYSRPGAPKYLQEMMDYLNSLTPNYEFDWSAAYTKMLYRILIPSIYSVPYWEYYKSDDGTRRKRSEYFYKLTDKQKLENVLQTYKSKCCRSETLTARKLSLCDWVSESKEHLRCHRSRLCPMCMFLNRAVPLYMGMLRSVNCDRDLRIYHLRYRSDQGARNTKEISLSVEQLSELRDKLQNAYVRRLSVRRWTGISLLGSHIKNLRVSLDLMYIAHYTLLPKFEKLAYRFPRNRCSFLYCYRATKENIQCRIGSFLQYPTWFLTAPFAETEYFLDTAVFKTRLSHF